MVTFKPDQQLIKQIEKEFFTIGIILEGFKGQSTEVIQ